MLKYNILNGCSQPQPEPKPEPEPEPVVCIDLKAIYLENLRLQRGYTYNRTTGLTTVSPPDNNLIWTTDQITKPLKLNTVISRNITAGLNTITESTYIILNYPFPFGLSTERISTVFPGDLSQVSLADMTYYPDSSNDTEPLTQDILDNFGDIIYITIFANFTPNINEATVVESSIC